MCVKPRKLKVSGFPWPRRFEKRYLQAVFAQHGQNITHAAHHAGIGRRHMRELLRKHGILDP